MSGPVSRARMRGFVVQEGGALPSEEPADPHVWLINRLQVDEDNQPLMEGIFANYNDDIICEVDSNTLVGRSDPGRGPAQRLEIGPGLRVENGVLIGDPPIAAVPFDALASNGMQINGGFQVSQELGTAGRTTSGYICDGWQLGKSGTMTATAFQNNNPSLPGFSHWLAMTITGTQASLGAAQYLQIFQAIEGYRISRLAWGTTSAQPITIGFWTAHTPSGLYTGSIRNGATNRSYSFTYTHAVAGSWQYNTVTIPGDTTGTWAADNGIGLYLAFSMAAGSSFTAPAANAWLAGNYCAAPGQINGVATTSNGFCLTGVTVHPGTQAPTATQSRLVARPYDQELLLCKRYFYNGVPPLRGGVSSAFVVSRMAAPHPVTMRMAPVSILTAPLPVYDFGATAVISSFGGSFNTTTVLEIEGAIGSALTPGRPCAVYQGSGGNVNVDARL